MPSSQKELPGTDPIVGSTPAAEFASSAPRKVGLLAAETGARARELFALTVEHVVFEK